MSSETVQALGVLHEMALAMGDHSTVEMPGSLPELAASAQYKPFEPFTSRANVMQAWSGYRTQSWSMSRVQKGWNW